MGSENVALGVVPDRIRTLVATIFFRRLRADNSVVCGGISLKFELIQAFMHALIPARMKKTESKMKSLDLPQHFPHY